MTSARPASGREQPLAVVVAVITYRRLDDLATTLPMIVAQIDADAPGAQVLVVDNDPSASARAVVDRLARPGVRYVVEPRPGIAAARNRALAESADDDLLIFIDDDERPEPGWLAALLATFERSGAGAVAGAVVSRFAGELDPWIAAGRFFDRRRLPTGTRIEVAATNNLLVDLRVVRAAALGFDERFGHSGGSDTLFTRRLSATGRGMVWCDEAVVIDEVPAVRMTRQWVLKRALRSGNSWSRTSLALAGPGAKPLVRLRLVGRSAPRLAGGSVGFLAGVLTRSMARRARGLRTLARGGGMLSGAFGYVYSEYRRPAGPAS